jgi:hypothetical protein
MRQPTFSAFVGLLALCVCGGAFAQTTACYQWSSPTNFGYTPPWESSERTVVDDIVGACQGKVGSGSNVCFSSCTGASTSCSVTVVSYGTVTTFPGYSGVQIKGTNNVGSNSIIAPSISSRPNPAGCGQCSAAGTQEFIGGGGGASGTSCVGGCLYNTPLPAMHIFGSGGATTTPKIYESTSAGQSCTSGDAGNGVTTADTQTDCDASGTICHTGNNCGTFNGDNVCVNTITPGTCVSYASGGVACAASGTGGISTPPAPDNGTPGTPATPSGAVTANGTTINYYSSTTVNAASAHPTTTTPIQAAPIGTQGLGGTSGGTGGGGPTAITGAVTVTSGTVAISGTVSTHNQDGVANGDCNVAAGKDCSVTGSAGTPGLGRADTIASLGNAFVAGVQASPLYVAVNGLATSFPDGGTCPSASFSVFDHDYDFMTTACTIWTDHIDGVLSVIMAACWALMGIWIVVSA